MPDLTTGPTILLGPAGSGKTQLLVQQLVAEERSLRPRWALLPDRVQVSAFRRRIARAGGALGISVGTFGDLFQEILARTGRPVAVMPEPARQRILRLSIRKLEAEGGIPYYAPIARTPGFLEAAGGAIAELKRSRVDAPVVTTLEQARVAEIGHIYGDYQARLESIPWSDREGLNDLAIEALADRPELVADMPLIVVDGFDSFEPAQAEALRALAEQVERLIVTLPGSNEMDRAAYRRFARPLKMLQEALPSAEVKMIDGPGALPAPLLRLEAGLFESGSKAASAEARIEMVEARGPAEEAREAVRWLKARLVREQIGLDECAVIAPDPAQYAPLLRRAADEFGLRLRFSQGEALHRAPAIAALVDLLELGRSDLPRRQLLQTVRSPYLDLSSWGLAPADSLTLDAASDAGQVVGGLEQWGQALEALASAEPEAELELADSEAPAFALPFGPEAVRLLSSLKALAGDLNQSGARPTSGWVEWLEDLLDELDFEPRTNDARDRPAFLRLRETLRALVLGQFVAGGADISFGGFLDELKSALESARYREDIPPFEPAVNVLRLLEARGARYQAVVVMGLSEGLLPEVEREDPFLDETTRATLGLESRLGREQGGLFYQAVTRAEARLLLTRPYLADDGEPWEPSPFWRAVDTLFEEQPRRIRPEDARPLADAGSPEELLFWGVRRGGMPAPLVEVQSERWSTLQHSRDVLTARGSQQPAGPFEGDLADLSPGLSAQYGDEHLWSPSRLETYGSCPHQFLVTYLLALEPREPPQLGLDAAQLGSILHEVLEEAYRAAEQPTELDSLLQALDKVLDPIFDRAPEKHGFRPTALWEVERQQYGEALRETITAMADLGGGWTPIEFELRFGSGETAPLTLELPGRSVQVRGIVDRLDRREDGGLRVIDYKTGSSRLTVSELHEGRRIQLPLYALGAQQALELGEVVEGFYWAILAAKRGSLRLSNYRPPEDGDVAGPAAAYATARAHVSRIVNGVNAGQFPPVPPPGGCPSYCPAAAWCWRYQPPAWGG